MRKKFLGLSIVAILTFTYLSFTVAKEKWQQIDFDFMVKLQDKIPRKFDQSFSYLTLLGNVELTLGFCILMAAIAILKGRFWASLGWFMIVPVSLAEVFGKLVLFHPGPPVFFHRTLLPQTLPQFYIQTNFSYPSGHMTRTIFIITIILCIMLFSRQRLGLKMIESFLLVDLIFIIALTRIYLGEHWLSDVLGGFLLGSAAGLFASIFVVSNKIK